MNKFIEAELKKCKVAQIPPFDKDTTELIIPKGTANIPNQSLFDDLQIGHKYSIMVEDYIIHPFQGFTLHDNWNNGIKPTDNRMHITVDQLMGKMVHVNSVGTTDNVPWVGWLPRKSITIIGELDD